MQKIINRSGTEQPEPGDSGFDQIVAAARLERILAAEPSLAQLGKMVVNETQESERGRQLVYGQVAVMLGPEPLVKVFPIAA